MNHKILVHGIGIGLICAILIAGALGEPKRQILFYVSGFGFLALLSLLLIISIPLLERFLKSPHTGILLANRRQMGIYSFIFALMHVVLVFNFFFAWDAGKILANPNSLFLTMGAIAFLMLALMAASSNDFSLKALGRNWKYLQYLIYPAVLLVLVHFIAVGKILAQNTLIVAILLLVALAVLALRFIPKQPK